jgi:hypothetical protein
MMRRLICAFLIILSILSFADAQAPKPAIEMTQQEWCANSLSLLGNRSLDQFQKAALLEAIRNRGCLSHPPAAPATVYSVQVASKRTEAEALEAFQAIQSKYPDMFAGRASVIRRADLGANGTVFRATVGPFSVASLAQDFCGRFKELGGMCVVQKD